MPLIVCVLCLGMVSTAFGEAQRFPSKRDAAGVSAFVLPASTGFDIVPDSWQVRTGLSFGSSAVADEAVTPTRTGATLSQAFGGLPQADYTVSILARGTGRARLAGQAQWAAFESKEANRYESFTLGEVTGTGVVELELRTHADWTAEDYVFHLKATATMLQHCHGAAVVLSAPHKWTQGTHLPPKRQQALVDALRQWTDETGLVLADVYAEYGDGEGDGIHPGDPGHRKIADAYPKALELAR